MTANGTDHTKMTNEEWYKLLRGVVDEHALSATPVQAVARFSMALGGNLSDAAVDEVSKSAWHALVKKLDAGCTISGTRVQTVYEPLMEYSTFFYTRSAHRPHVRRVEMNSHVAALNHVWGANCAGREVDKPWSLNNMPEGVSYLRIFNVTSDPESFLASESFVTGE